MNKPTALLALLWQHNLPSLKAYLQRNQRVVILFSGYADQETIKELEATGSQIKLLNVTVGKDMEASADQAIKLAKLALQRHGTPENLPCAIDGKVLPDIYGDVLAQYLPSVFSLLNELQQIESEYFIEAVLLNEESLWLGKTVAGWAKQHEIPSVHLSHGTGIAKNYNFEHYKCDTIAVFGERGTEYYIDSGVPRERLEVIGNPNWSQFSQLKQDKSAVRRALCERTGLDHSLPIIVFGTTWNAYLSALDDRDLTKELTDFFAIYTQLAEKGFQLQLVVKDRLVTEKNNQELVFDVARRQGVPLGRIRYELADAQSWVVAADVVVSIESNLSVEAVLAETPAINLISPFGMLTGPGFTPEDAVVHCEPSGLADAVQQILSSNQMREELRQKMRRNAERFNRGVDGKAEDRFCDLIERKRRSSSEQGGKYVWQSLLAVDEADATQYHNWPRSELVDLAPRPFRRVLDIGCAAGKTGEYIKQKFPQAKVYGVEVNLTAAAIAAKRLDGVFAGKFEDFDFAAYGIAHGSLDTVIVADVLEHIYDPWGVLTRLRPYLTSDAQILASIPNTRNLALMNGLAEGDWRYEAWGLLDVTHIRFFTLKEIRRFFHETGYRVMSVNKNLDSRLAGLYQAHRDKPVINIDFDRFTLKKVTQDELSELCTLQFFVVAEPGAVDDKVFTAQEKARVAAEEVSTAYELWRSARELTKIQGDLYEQRMAAWKTQPVFYLVLMANPLDEVRLGASIQSLASQYYYKLHLTVVTPSAPPANWADSDRLAWRQAPDDKLIDAANRALLEGEADWVGMIDAGDTVAAHSFLFIAEAINTHPDWSFIYSDEDEATPDGKYEQPRFKPDFNLDLLRSTHYTGGLALLSKALFGRLNGFASAMKGAEDYDLVLRAFDETGAGGIGHLPDVLYHRLKNGGRWCLPAGELVETGKLAVALHLSRSGIPGAVEHGLFPASYRLRYEHKHKPRVSILVAVRDQIETVQRCVESVLGATRYPDYELLLIDNDSTHPESHAFLAGLEAMDHERIRVYSHPAAASLPQLHNLLAHEATGDYLLFLYFDAAIVQEDWLDSLMAHGLRTDVGLVAPRLLRSDGTVEQAGLVLGLNKAVDTVFHGEALDHAGYMGRAHLEQDFSALGGGCLLVRKTIFIELGGFDAENFAAAYAEVDFSRRAIDQGWLAVWTPFVNVLCSGKAAHHAWRNTHIEGGSFQSERSAATEHLYQRCLPQLARDTAYNVNFSLAAGKYFSVETCSSLTWDPLPWKPLPRILVQPADSAGCGEYRVISPARALVNAGRVQGWTDFHIFSVPEMARLDVDAIILQRQTMPEQLEAIARHKKFNRALKVYELDDLLIKLPMKSTHRTHMPKDINRKLRQAIAMCDRFVVSTEPLKEAYRDYHSDIRVVPNCVERARWDGFSPLRRQSERPRVGWAGGIGHTGDLEMIFSVVKALADQVDWVFMGMCPDEMRSWVKEFHPGVPLEQFPAKLASLNLDLAIAPLELNPFNEAKSHLRLLEYGILGYPVVCSDAYPYRGDYPVTRVRNRHKDWVDAILDQVADLDKCAQNGDLLRSYVESRWVLEDNLEMWMKAWLP